MPTLAGYLAIWSNKDDLRFKKAMSQAQDISLYAPPCSNCVAEKNSYHFIWSNQTTFCFIREFQRIANLQHIMKKRCYSYGDRLTLTMPDILRRESISKWHPLALYMLVEITALVNKEMRTFARTKIDIAYYAKAVIERLRKPETTIPVDLETSVEIIDTCILEDPVAKLGKLFKSYPPEQFQIISNVVL
jgi:hypothetical protein